MNKYRISISGKNKAQFLKFLISRKIKLFDIVMNKDELRITVLEDDFIKIMKYKTTYKIKIINRFGIPKFKYLIQKYKYLIISSIFIIFVIILLSNIIFSVEVVHQNEEVRDLVLKDLNYYGLKKYNFKISYEKKEYIKNKILEKEKDKLEWIEIDNIGTKYIVNVEERKIINSETDNLKRDIVAKKDAMILEIKSDNGEILKKKYDYVTRGDVIISGTIKNKDKEVAKVKASGKVYGEVWYNVDVSLPTIYHEEIRNGNVKRGFSLKIADKSYSLGKNNKSYDAYDTILFEDKLLPFKFVFEKKYELNIIDKKYNLQNSSKEALKIAEETLLKKLDKESTILYKKVLKKTINNSTIVVDVFFKVKEDITDFVLIDDQIKEGEEDEGNN